MKFDNSNKSYRKKTKDTPVSRRVKTTKTPSDVFSNFVWVLYQSFSHSLRMIVVVDQPKRNEVLVFKVLGLTVE